MSDTTHVSFTAKYASVSAWSGALKITLLNNTGKTINSPVKISFDMPQSVQPSTNIGLNIEKTGISTTHITGQLANYLTPIADGKSVSFIVNIGSNNGSLSADVLPIAYYVNGVLAGDSDTPDTTAPSAPTGLVSTGTTSSTIALSWNASTDDVGVSGYIVTWSWANGRHTKRVPNTTTILDGLSADTQYTISVQAYDAAGNVSDNTGSISVLTRPVSPDTTAPSVPVNLHVTRIAHNAISLAWNASTDEGSGVKNYVVSYAEPGASSQTVTVTTTSATIGGLKPNTLYTFRVFAVDNAGNQSARSTAINGKTSGKPSTGAGATDFAPYVDVTIFAKWATTPPGLNQDFISDAIAFGVKKFHLAFLVQDPANPKNPVWGNSSFPLKAIKPLTDLINNAGGEPIFSFGGFSGVDFSTTWSVNDLAGLYVNIANNYGVKTIDLDFETQGFYNSNVAFPAFVQAKKAVPYLEVSVTLPVLPTGLVQAGLDVLTSAAANKLHPYVNIMAMDYGPSFAGNQGDYAIQAINATKDQLKAIWGYTDAEAYSKIVVTPMIGHNDTDPLVFTLEDAVKVAEFSKANNLHQVSNWSLGRDFAPDTIDEHGNMHSNSKPTSTLITGQENYAFAKAFAKVLS